MRTTYTDDFRRFVIELVGPGGVGEGVSTGELADLTGVSVGTLKGWLATPEVVTPPSASPAAPDTADTVPGATGTVSVSAMIRDAHHQLIFAQWQSWVGTFKGFCSMLRSEHRLRYGDSYIGNFLQAAQLRHRRRRRPVEAPWSSDTYQRFFPNAQWLGDGTSLAIPWGDEVYTFNVEAIHDVFSAATLGFAVSDTEDEEALRLAYRAALETTQGQPPHVLMLDNRPSNHSPGALEATAGTTVLRSTPYRGQSKAPIEGAFGLFKQAMPPLTMPAGEPREQARAFLGTVLTAWFRGRNGRPHRRFKKTPFEMQAETPSPEDIERFLAWQRERQRLTEEAQKTREARRDAVRIELLKAGFLNLEISDPDSKLAVALAYYSRDAIAQGLAVFAAKKTAGQIPPNADPGRYLGGIIRNIDTRLELETIATHLLLQRLRLRDLTLAPLQKAADAVRTQSPLPSEQLNTFVDNALNARLEVDARFWMHAAADALQACPDELRQPLYRTQAKRAAASFRSDRLRREDLINQLARAVADPELVISRERRTTDRPPPPSRTSPNSVGRSSHSEQPISADHRRALRSD